jgi:hypothetical protein
VRTPTLADEVVRMGWKEVPLSSGDARIDGSGYALYLVVIDEVCEVRPQAQEGGPVKNSDAPEAPESGPEPNLEVPTRSELVSLLASACRPDMEAVAVDGRIVIRREIGAPTVSDEVAPVDPTSSGFSSTPGATSVSLYDPETAQLEREGYEEGRAEGLRQGLLTVLRIRDIAVSDAAGERILAEKDPDRLERWLKKAAISWSLSEVLDD